MPADDDPLRWFFVVESPVVQVHLDAGVVRFDA
jgi:hypothetical protein